jgi:hypothetical protein
VNSPHFHVNKKTVQRLLVLAVFLLAVLTYMAREVIPPGL